MSVNVPRLIKSYEDDILFQVGERVILDLDEVVPEHRYCETGIVTEIKTRFPAFPNLRRIYYCVKLDDMYIKPEHVLVKNFSELIVNATQLIRLKGR